MRHIRFRFTTRCDFGGPRMPSPDRTPRQPSSDGYVPERGPVNQHSGGNDYDRNGPTGFSIQERQAISDCYVNDRAGLPPGFAKKDRLPPGLERQLQRNGTLPPGLEKRVQPLPEQCSTRLPRLPRDWSRVVLSGRIILLDPRQRIVDLFWLQN